MRFNKETQEIKGWQVTFRNNVHMYCHYLEVVKGSSRFDIPCEDTPAEHIGIWVMDLKVEDKIRSELIEVLAKFFDGLGSHYKIYAP